MRYRSDPKGGCVTEDCGKCLHEEVCVWAKVCVGRPQGCKHFVDKSGMALASCKLGAKGCFTDGKCRYKKACENKVITRADQTRAMTDEQLADAFYKVYCELGSGGPKDLSNLFCDGKAGCVTKNGDVRCSEKKVRACILRWFRQPVEEGTP